MEEELTDAADLGGIGHVHDLPLLEDRVTARSWKLDLALAGKARPPAKRPARRKRQRIARFEGREGTVERFSLRQTFPHPQHEAFSPPSQSQYGAVSDFFAEVCEAPKPPRF